MKRKRTSCRAPARAVAKAVQTQPEIVLDSPPAGRDSEYKPVDRYLAQLEVLHGEAYRSDTFAVLADVMAWHLARIAVTRIDPTEATGDIIRLFGAHVCDLVRQQHVQAEAENAKAEGVAVH